MASDKISVLLSDVSVEGDLVEKDKIIIDGKINGDIKANEIATYSNSNIKGNIKSKSTSLKKNNLKIEKERRQSGTIRQILYFKRYYTNTSLTYAHIIVSLES